MSFFCGSVGMYLSDTLRLDRDGAVWKAKRWMVGDRLNCVIGATRGEGHGHTSCGEHLQPAPAWFLASCRCRRSNQESENHAKTARDSGSQLWLQVALPESASSALSMMWNTLHPSSTPRISVLVHGPADNSPSFPTDGKIPQGQTWK